MLRLPVGHGRQAGPKGGGDLAGGSARMRCIQRGVNDRDVSGGDLGDFGLGLGGLEFGGPSCCVRTSGRAIWSVNGSGRICRF